jgi:hypothetical protein
VPDCDHGAVTPAACHLCRGEQPTATTTTITISRAFKARHDDRCTGCGFDIRSGEQVRYVDDRLRHVGCTDG